MEQDNEKVKGALAKIKSKKKPEEKPAEHETPAKEETQEPLNETGEEDKVEVISILQDAGVYRREMLLRANVQVDLLREGVETLKRMEEDQKNLIEFLKS